MQIREGLHYNPYFPGGAIAMPKMLNDGAVEYEDGTPATEAQVCFLVLRCQCLFFLSSFQYAEIQILLSNIGRWEKTLFRF